MSQTSARQPASRLRDTDRPVRVHLPLFDRLKFLILISLTFLVLVWADLADDPLLSFSDAVTLASKHRIWLLVLLGTEVLRQIHFGMAELLAPYHGFWQRYFAFVERSLLRIGDWNRYRLSRVFKGLLLLILLAFVLGAVYKETPIKALFLAPKAL